MVGACAKCRRVFRENVRDRDRRPRTNPGFFDTAAYLRATGSGGDAVLRKARSMKKKYFGFEQAFEHIWNNADRDGIRNGDAATVAAEFHVSEDEAHEVLSDLAERVERLHI
jgi:hypothetical protein